jgi:hypothetical protein
VPSPPVARPSEPELKLPSDAEVDKVISFLERAWRRLLEMGRDLPVGKEGKRSTLRGLSVAAYLSSLPTAWGPSLLASLKSKRSASSARNRPRCLPAAYPNAAAKERG